MRRALLVTAAVAIAATPVRAEPPARAEEPTRAQEPALAELNRVSLAGGASFQRVILPTGVRLFTETSDGIATRYAAAVEGSGRILGFVLRAEQPTADRQHPLLATFACGRGCTRSVVPSILPSGRYALYAVAIGGTGRAEIGLRDLRGSVSLAPAEPVPGAVSGPLAVSADPRVPGTTVYSRRETLPGPGLVATSERISFASPGHWQQCHPSHSEEDGSDAPAPDAGFGCGRQQDRGDGVWQSGAVAEGAILATGARAGEFLVGGNVTAPGGPPAIDAIGLWMPYAPAAPGPPPAAGAPAASSAWLTTIGGAHLSRRTLRIRLRCLARAACRGKATLARRRYSIRVSAGRTRTVRLKLSRATARRLARRSATVRIAGRDGAGRLHLLILRIG